MVTGKPSGNLTTIGGRMKIIEDRQETHGNFVDNASVAQRIKAVLRTAPGWDRMSPVQKEALDLISIKVARIVSGKNREPDHWKDIKGYAYLALMEIEDES
jgi:hypothetical protein